jgi:thiaminase/transcriptional activator TenA
MTPEDLITRHTDIWHNATHHPFLDAIRNGTLDPNIFATWLIQDYFFVFDELSCLARLLARAPREGQHILVSGLAALEAEACWFEEHAKEKGLTFDLPRYPAALAYRDFFLSLDQQPYPIAITAIWAVERAYLNSWMNTMPCQPRYRAYAEHWANKEFAQFVDELARITTQALTTGKFDDTAEAAFLNVARLEHGFWQMAWTEGEEQA